VWVALGVAAIVAGHHAPFRFAASQPPTPREPAAASLSDGDQGHWFTPGEAHPRHARSSSQA
jgi:hypothetical protein